MADEYSRYIILRTCLLPEISWTSFPRVFIYLHWTVMHTNMPKNDTIFLWNNPHQECQVMKTLGARQPNALKLIATQSLKIPEDVVRRRYNAMANRKMTTI